MKIAYADPPYIGCAQKRYGDPTYDDPEEHFALIYELERKYDGWAFSLHEPSLRVILPMCPEGVRVAAWVKPFAVFRRGVDPAYTWEPVIYKSAREWNPLQHTVRDYVSCNITMKKGTIGAKPKDFCFWIFDLLGMTPEDEFYDLFLGSGSVTKFHKEWCAGFPHETSVIRY